MTTKRIQYLTAAPGAVRAFSEAAKYFEGSSIERSLRYMVELRVSQINGCSYCIDLHSRQLRKEGETEQRIDCLQVWDEVPFYTERERAALEWAESVTRVESTRVPDDVYGRATALFSEKELVELTFVVANMNLWNRLAISFRRLPIERK